MSNSKRIFLDDDEIDIDDEEELGLFIETEELYTDIDLNSLDILIVGNIDFGIVIKLINKYSLEHIGGLILDAKDRYTLLTINDLIGEVVFKTIH